MDKLVPILKVFDIERSLDFYQNILGATLNWRWQQDKQSANPSYVSLSLFSHEVHLSSFAGDGAFGSTVYFYTKDIDTLHQRLLITNRSCIEMNPTLQPWKMYELYIRDPDNNNLRFGVDKTGDC